MSKCDLNSGPSGRPRNCGMSAQGRGEAVAVLVGPSAGEEPVKDGSRRDAQQGMEQPSAEFRAHRPNAPPFQMYNSYQQTPVSRRGKPF
jgi:hypothetical protein